MSVRRNLAALLPGALLLSCGAAQAVDDEVPDMAFLEYLGMWEQSDDEWLVFENDSTLLAKESDKRIDSAPQSEDSTENVDED